jgi:predicted  nucleic acid-binding Zn-ribbon protein
LQEKLSGAIEHLVKVLTETNRLAADLVDVAQVFAALENEIINIMKDLKSVAIVNLS